MVSDAATAPDATGSGIAPLSPADLKLARIVAGQVPDPEVPVLTIADLGVLRDVGDHDGHLRVTITPTYSGCPAVQAISDDLRQRLRAAGFPRVEVLTTLTPAWTTEWMSEEGRRKLAEYGIAPPQRRAGGAVPLSLAVRCPQCGSPRTRELSRFGSTACKSLHVCQDCAEPFDHFKDH